MIKAREIPRLQLSLPPSAAAITSCQIPVQMEVTGLQTDGKLFLVELCVCNVRTEVLGQSLCLYLLSANQRRHPHLS